VCGHSLYKNKNQVNIDDTIALNRKRKKKKLLKDNNLPKVMNEQPPWLKSSGIESFKYCLGSIRILHSVSWGASCSLIPDSDVLFPSRVFVFSLRR